MSDILVVIAAYNEQNTIGQVVKDIFQVLDNTSYTIIVASDGSTDNTILEAKEAGATILSRQHSGRAGIFRHSMSLINIYNPRIIVTTDADGQYRAKDIPKLLRAISRGNDLVLGSRLRGRIEYMPLNKKWLNIIATTLLRWWLRQDITDATTGLRAFTPEVARLPIKSNYTYTVEQTIRTARAGLKISCVPVSFHKRKDGQSRLMKNSTDYIWQTIKNTRKMLS